MIRAIALTGPTASGKTALSLSLAERLSCEIISLDSMQLYRTMDIGTAKATPAELARVPHHMLDILSPEESFSTSDYREVATKIAGQIQKRGNLPLFVGGTGLYLETLRRTPMPVPKADPDFSDRMRAFAEKKGEDALWQRLYEVSPRDAELIHKNNVRRVIRALEVYETTGKTKYEWDELSKTPPTDISILHITLNYHDRERLYARCDARIEEMLKMGLVEEARGLLEAGVFDKNPTARQAIGYKELFGYLAGEETLDAAKERLRLATRHYVKRQLTWFSAHPPSYTLYMDDEDGALREPRSLIDEILLQTEPFFKGYSI